MYRRGIVRETDPAGARARVEFSDRDSVVSWWLDINMPAASAGGSRVYAMPEVGAQVNCLLDERAEEGTILGAIYSDVDAPPVGDGNLMHMALAGGGVVSYDKGLGTLLIDCPGGITITAGGTTVRIEAGGVAIESPALTHNGVNVGDTHKHIGIVPGPDETGPPA